MKKSLKGVRSEHIWKEYLFRPKLWENRELFKTDLSEELPEVVWVEGGERADAVVGHGDVLPSSSGLPLHSLFDLSLHQKRSLIFDQTYFKFWHLHCTCYLFYFEVIHEKDKLEQHSEKISVPKVAKLRLFFCSNSSAQQYFSYIVFITKISAFAVRAELVRTGVM